MMNAQGTLIVRPICARLSRDTDFLSKMDPYCQISIGNQVQKTGVASGAGKNPAWQNQLVFKISLEDIMRIAIYDYDFNSRDDVVAEGSCPLSRVIQNRDWSDTVELTYKGRPAGNITINSTFTLDNSYAPQMPTVVLVNQIPQYPPNYAVPSPYQPVPYPPAPTYQPSPAYQPPPVYQSPPAYQPAPAYPQGYAEYPPVYPSGSYPGGYYPDPNYPVLQNPDAHLHQPGCPYHY